MKKFFLAVLVFFAFTTANAQNQYVKYGIGQVNGILKWYNETGTQVWGLGATSLGGDTIVSEGIDVGFYDSCVVAYILKVGDTIHYNVAVQYGVKDSGASAGFYAPGWSGAATGAVNTSQAVPDSIVSVLTGQTYPGTGGQFSLSKSLITVGGGTPGYIRFVLLPYKVGDTTMNGNTGTERTFLRNLQVWLWRRTP